MRKSLFIKDYRVVTGVQNHFAQKKRGSKFLSENHFYKLLILLNKLERAMGFEPTTSTLARLRSTPELYPHYQCERLFNST